MKWLLIALVVIADKIYDKYFDEVDDEWPTWRNH